MKIKKYEKINRYFVIVRELIKPLYLRMSVIPFGTFGTFPKGLEKKTVNLETRGRIKTIQTTDIDENSQNIETSSGDQRRLAITKL